MIETLISGSVIIGLLACAVLWVASFAYILIRERPPNLTEWIAFISYYVTVLCVLLMVILMGLATMNWWPFQVHPEGPPW